jgi:hypothetical protein
LNHKVVQKGTYYVSFYNEIFINGQREIGNAQTVELFDRNRFYGAIGYMVAPKIRIQLGVMNQTTDNWSKNQLQVSLHHKI